MLTCFLRNFADLSMFFSILLSLEFHEIKRFVIHAIYQPLVHNVSKITGNMTFVSPFAYAYHSNGRWPSCDTSHAKATQALCGKAHESSCQTIHGRKPMACIMHTHMHNACTTHAGKPDCTVDASVQWTHGYSAELSTMMSAPTSLAPRADPLLHQACAWRRCDAMRAG